MRATSSSDSLAIELHSSHRASQRKKLNNLMKIKNDLQEKSQMANEMQKAIHQEKEL